jgi:hypothetical protein
MLEIPGTTRRSVSKGLKGLSGNLVEWGFKSCTKPRTEPSRKDSETYAESPGTSLNVHERR